MSWLDYDLLGDDLKGRVRTVAAFNEVYKDADERDVNFNKMPFADVRLSEDDPQIRTGQDYYNFTTFEIEIVAHSLKSQGDAARVRNDLLRSTIDAVRAQPRFNADLNGVKIGPITFALAADEKTGAFVAACVVKVICESYVDRS